MNLSETQLFEIEQLAALFLTVEEIAILTNIDYNEFGYEISQKKGLAYLHYMKGKTESKKMIHENVVKLAKHGSPQAEEMAKELIFQQELSERHAKP